MQKENIKLYMTIHIHNRSKINEQIDGRNVKEKKKKKSKNKKQNNGKNDKKKKKKSF